MDLAERLARWLDHRDLTQADLARSVGVSTSAVAQWFIGETEPTRSNLDKIVEAFDITLSEFWGDLPKASSGPPKRKARAS